MTQTTDQERAEFEAWAGREYRNADAYTKRDYAMGFAAWQAARRAPVVPETIEQRAKKLKSLQATIGATAGVPEAIELARSRFVEAYGRSPLHDDLAYASLLIDAFGAPVVPQFSQVAKKKLGHLLEAGEAITGYAIENKYGRRGAIDCHGFVYWWNDAAAHQPPQADHIPDAGKMAAKHCDLCKSNGGYYYGKSGNEPCCV